MRLDSPHAAAFSRSYREQTEPEVVGSVPLAVARPLVLRSIGPSFGHGILDGLRNRARHGERGRCSKQSLKATSDG